MAGIYDVGYHCDHFVGRPAESRADKLRSIVAQMVYTYEINCRDKRGVPFTRNMYVPEIHPVTLTLFHEREDEGHVFKVQLLIVCSYSMIMMISICSA